MCRSMTNDNRYISQSVIHVKTQSPSGLLASHCAVPVQSKERKSIHIKVRRRCLIRQLGLSEAEETARSYLRLANNSSTLLDRERTFPMMTEGKTGLKCRHLFLTCKPPLQPLFLLFTCRRSGGMTRVSRSLAATSSVTAGRSTSRL